MNELFNNGWICLYRKFVKWEWYKNTNVKVLFLHCLLKANHEPKKWEGKLIQRGQFVTGRKILAKELNLSEQQIRTALDKLKSTNEITTQVTPSYTIITLKNYNQYQNYNQEDNQRVTNEQPTNNQRVTTTNNDNNITIITNNNMCNSEILKNFEIFWEVYPRKTNKLTALEEYTLVIKSLTANYDDLLVGAKKYQKYVEKNKIQQCFVKIAQNWLIKQCWKDEYNQQADNSRKINGWGL